MALRWYVVQTKTNLESYAAEQLNRQGFKTFVPQYLSRGVRRGVVVMRVLPFFPSYMFTAFDVEIDRWKAVCSTRGVLQLVTATEERVSALPIGFVENMMASSNSNGLINYDDGFSVLEEYAPGTKLLITDGKFKGMQGICVQSGQKRVTLLLSLLSRQVKVTLSPASVTPVSESSDRARR